MPGDPREQVHELGSFKLRVFSFQGSHTVLQLIDLLYLLLVLRNFCIFQRSKSFALSNLRHDLGDGLLGLSCPPLCLLLHLRVPLIALDLLHQQLLFLLHVGDNMRGLRVSLLLVKGPKLPQMLDIVQTESALGAAFSRL